MKKKENSTTLRRGEGCCHRAASNVVVVAGNVEKFNCVCLHINVSWCKVVENKQSWTYQTVFNNIINKEWDKECENLPYKGNKFVSGRIYYQHSGFINNIPVLLQTFRIYYIIYD